MVQSRLFVSSDSQQQSHRYWMHRVAPEFLTMVAMRKFIGSRSAHARKVKELRKGDAVLLVTTLLVPQGNNLPPTKRIAFVAAAWVEAISNMPHPEVGYDKHKVKLKLRDIRGFVEPLLLEDVARLGVDFIVGKKKLSDAMDFEYREITEDDFYRIVASRSIVNGLPNYISDATPRTNVKFSDKQLISMFKLTRELLRTAFPMRPEIEIKLFLGTLAGLLQGAGVAIDYDAVYAEYRRLAHKVGFRHKPSRDTDLQVELLDETGRPRRFAFISLR